MDADQGPILTIRLYPRESECIACGAPLSDCRQGIPFYEDQALPSTWEGGDGKEWPEGWGKEHGGHDACGPCFRAQATITEPTPLRELARRAYLGIWLGEGV